MGPSVKFVSAIKDAIFNKKMGVIFFLKKCQTGGEGPRGSLAKDHTFSGFSFVHPSLTSLYSFVKQALNSLLLKASMATTGVLYVTLSCATKGPSASFFFTHEHFVAVSQRLIWIEETFPQISLTCGR